MPESHVVPLDGFPFDLAPSIEPLACCLHAVEMLGVGPDDPAVVVGAGTLGVIGMWALQSTGARVAVVEITLTDGTQLADRVEAVRGTVRNPMPRGEVVEDRCDRYRLLDG